MSVTPGPAPPLSERICTAACLGFAGFTLCAHAVVAAGGSLRTLVMLFGAVVAAWLVLRRWRSGDARDAALAADVALPQKPSPAWLRQVAIGFALAATGVAFAVGDGVVAWALLVASLGVAAIPFLLRESASFESPVDGRSSRVLLALMAGFCALYALVVHRPDADDSGYVNMAVGAVDLPALPLLATDTMHGLAQIPMDLPIYKLHSYELFIGALSLLSGIPAVAVFHWIAAAFAAALVPLAHATLFRLLTPRCWPVTTAALVIVLVAVGETHRWYGNFGLVRIWQGKAILLSVAMPLVYAFAIQFARRPDSAGWVRLAAAQIASLGLSSAALWAAPAGAVMALCSVLRPGRSGLRQLAIGAFASAYLIVAGLLLKSGTTQAIPELAASTDPIWGAIMELGGDATEVERALATVLGQGRIFVLGIACLFLSWVGCRPGPARRFAIALPLGTALVLLNPLTEHWVAANLTGPLFWRATWALPIPILMALVLVTPLRLPGAAGRLACAALIATFALAAPSSSGFSASNGATIAWPRLKLPPVHRFAQRLNELAPHQPVVAPGDVATWVTVYHDHAYPLSVRHYLRGQRNRIGEDVYRERVAMTRFVSGEDRDPTTAAIFEQGLERYAVKAVCLALSENTATAREILRRAGFEQNLQGIDLEIWVRKAS